MSLSYFPFCCYSLLALRTYYCGLLYIWYFVTKPLGHDCLFVVFGNNSSTVEHVAMLLSLSAMLLVVNKSEYCHYHHIHFLSHIKNYSSIIVNNTINCSCIMSIFIFYSYTFCCILLIINVLLSPFLMINKGLSSYKADVAMY